MIGSIQMKRKHGRTLELQKLKPEKIGLALFSPMKSKIKGYPFEVKLPDGYGVTGVVLSDPSRGATKAAMDRCSDVWLGCSGLSRVNLRATEER